MMSRTFWILSLGTLALCLAITLIGAYTLGLQGLDQLLARYAGLAGGARLAAYGYLYQSWPTWVRRLAPGAEDLDRRIAMRHWLIPSAVLFDGLIFPGWLRAWL